MASQLATSQRMSEQFCCASVNDLERQDDPSKPFIPTVDGIVLPLPTSLAKRRARATSFTVWSASTPLEAISEPLDQADKSKTSSPNGRRSSLRRTVRFHEPSSPHHNHVQDNSNNNPGIVNSYLSDSDREEIDSQQDFDEIDCFANSINFDSSQLISFEMLTPPSGLKGGEMEVRTLLPVRRTPGDESPLTVKHKTRIFQQSSCQVSNLV